MHLVGAGSLAGFGWPFGAGRQNRRLRLVVGSGSASRRPSHVDMPALAALPTSFQQIPALERDPAAANRAANAHSSAVAATDRLTEQVRRLR